MYDIDCCTQSWEFRSFLCLCNYTRKWNNFAIVFGAIVLVLNTNLEHLLPVSDYQGVIVAWFGTWGLVTITIINKMIHSCRTRGAFHYAKDSGNFGWNSNGKVRFGFFRPEYSGSLLEVVHLFRLEYFDRNSPFHFWQTGSLPLLGNSEMIKKWQELFLLVGAV